MSETGRRLYSALITDGLFERIVRGHPDPGAIADELGNEKIVEIPCKELEELTDDERERLAGDAGDHMRHLIAAVGKAAFKAMKNGIIASDDITPDFLVKATAALVVATATK